MSLQHHQLDSSGQAPITMSSCKVAGCSADLQHDKPYSQARRVCSCHMQADAVKCQGHGNKLFRFCLQCGRLEPLDAFDSLKRTCRKKLQLRRARSQSTSYQKKSKTHAIQQQHQHQHQHNQPSHLHSSLAGAAITPLGTPAAWATLEGVRPEAVAAGGGCMGTSISTSISTGSMLAAPTARRSGGGCFEDFLMQVMEDELAVCLFEGAGNSSSSSSNACCHHSAGDREMPLAFSSCSGPIQHQQLAGRGGHPALPAGFCISGNFDGLSSAAAAGGVSESAAAALTAAMVSAQISAAMLQLTPGATPSTAARPSPGAAAAGVAAAAAGSVKDELVYAGSRYMAGVRAVAQAKPSNSISCLSASPAGLGHFSLDARMQQLRVQLAAVQLQLAALRAELGTDHEQRAAAQMAVVQPNTGHCISPVESLSACTGLSYYLA